MKLNLLPTQVSSSNRARNAIIGSVLLVLLSGIASALLIIYANRELEKAVAREEAARPPAENAVTVAKRADTLVAQPEVKALITDNSLAKAMLAHNAVYPAVYGDVIKFIPSFFRLTSLSATPVDATTSTITMQGVIRSYQEYADLMLALLRTKGARITSVKSVSRSGFVGVEPYVPALTPIDQVGRPIKPGQDPIPDDPLERLTYFQDLPREGGYLNSGGFGSGEEGIRTITPNASLITVQMTVDLALQTPDPRATLAAIGSAVPAAGASGAPATAGFPGAPPGPPRGTIPSAPGAPGAASAAGRPDEDQ